MPPDVEEGTDQAKAEGEGSGLTGDWGAIGLLMLLYTLQGIPMGLCGSVPLIMQELGVSMDQQAIFSFVSWPFSLKLLWAPIVDALYVPGIGRRKTWIIPAQMAIGILLIWSSWNIEAMLQPSVASIADPSGATKTSALGNTTDVTAGGAAGSGIDVWPLTYLFLSLYMLAATQDIAVDGLALTILSPRNKELGATCNAIGQSFGYFVAYVVFIFLSQQKLVTLGGFMGFWGWIFVVSTAAVVLVKKDEHHVPPGSLIKQLGSAYREMGVVLSLPAVRSACAMLLTARMGFAVFDNITPLLMTSAGVPKNHLASIAGLMMPVSMAVQAYISRSFAGNDSKPISMWISCYMPRLVLGVLAMGIVAAAKSMQAGAIAYWLYVLMILYSVGAATLSGGMFVAIMAFFNKVSDPVIGGTYMTLLNTIANLGSVWPTTMAFWAVNLTTLKHCEPLKCKGDSGSKPPVVAFFAKFWSMLTNQSLNATAGAGGDCGCEMHTYVEGYYVVGVFSICIGTAWLLYMRPRLIALENLSPAAWKVGRQRRDA